MDEYEKLNIIVDKKNLYSGVFIDQGLSLDKATKRYQKRREDFLKDLKYPVIIFGNDKDINQEVWHSLYIPINQEPLMLYLTGINQPECALFMDPKLNKQIIFVNKKDKLKEFWTGVTLGIDDGGVEVIQKLVGIDDVQLMDNLYFLLSDYIDKNEITKMGVLLHDGYDIQNKVSKLVEDCNYRNFSQFKKTLIKEEKNIQYFNILRYQFDKRLCLDDVDVSNIRKANEIHKDILINIWKKMKSFRFENEVSGKLQGEFLSHSSTGLSFAPIVAGGKNATCLHYTKNDDPLVEGELLLIDSGLKVGSVMNDVTRTFPINGEFDPMQKILYQIVLDSQQEMETRVKEGVLFFDLDKIVWQFIEDELQKRFVSKGGEYKRFYDKKPHGLGHLVGEMIHDGDIFREYHRQPMKAGWVVTNEPGLYGYFKIELEGKKYSQYIGIRIEDDLLVTKDGCENLSSMIPKEIKEIEELIIS